MDNWWVPFLFFLIATFYSSVGFGGGSSYLAVLSLLITDFYEIRTLALLLNLVVVSLGTIMFIRSKVFSWREFWPFIVFSIPAAFFGAQLRLSENVFFLILGGSLFLAGVFMMLQLWDQRTRMVPLNVPKSAALGSSVGLLSGLAGIGGGIFLSPTLNLMRWKTPKKVAALASFFIMLNSIAGLTGLIVADSFRFDTNWSPQLMVAVFAGGLLGSYLTNSKFDLRLIRVLTAILVIYVGSKLLAQHGFGIHI